MENTIKAVDIGTAQMLRSTSFWEIYIYTTLLHCVGMTVISFARDLFVSYGADTALAVSLVGLVSICNGGIRIVIGWMYDNLGRRFSVLFTNELVIAAAGFILLGIFCNSLLLVAIGACFAGCSYGCLPTTEVVLMRSFYGERDFSTNFGIVSTCIIPASFMSTLSGSLISNSGSYTSVFVILLACSVIAMAFTFAIRRV